MKPRNTGYAARLILSGTLLLFIQACSTEIGGNEDNTKPVAVLTSLLGGEEVIGTHVITWDMQESNRSVIDIYISSDSGASYSLMELDVADTGSFEWDSNTVDDCKTCRMRVVPRDVVGNIGDPSDSPADFEVNNIPNLVNAALFYDINNDGMNEGDKIIVQFDKDVEAFTTNVNDIFVLPVLGDFIGLSPFINITSDFSKLELVINGVVAGKNFHLHAKGAFSKQRVNATSPSGLVLRPDIAGSLIAPDTGRSARPLSSVDIFPAFSKRTTALSQGLNLTQDIALADFDNDGDLDMLSVDVATPPTTTNGTNLWRNDGAGGYSAINTLSGINNNDNATAVAVGDVDNDGDIDFVLGLSDGTANQVWKNQLVESVGLNLFDFQKAGLGSDIHSTDALALGDVDNDGDLDLVTGNSDFANLVWINNGPFNLGSFSHDSGQPGHVLGNNLDVTRAVKFADVDNDNDLDILFGNDGSPDQVWINNGSGSFTNSGQSLGNDASYAITVGDVDNDGDIDFVTGIINGANKLWLNGGSGVFSESGQSLVQPNTNQTRAVLLVDVDSDNDLDLIVGDEAQPNRVWFNDGKGVFEDTGQAMGASASYAFAAADIDRDGDIDLVEAVRGQPNVVWINPATITPFISIPQEDNRYNTASIALGDIDGDGDLDMVEGNALQGNRVYINDRSVFRDTFQTLAGDNTTKVLLGDVDNDNDLDLIIANASAPDNADLVYSNNGLGVFTNSGQSLGSDDTQAAVLGDVDDDGDLDLVTGHSGGTTLWLNTAGIFTDSGQGLSTNNTRELVIEDMDNDGDLDLVFATASGNETWVNNANNLPAEKGVFTPLPAITFGGNVFAIDAGDINGDGKPDLAYGTTISRTAMNNPAPLPDPDPGTNNYITCTLPDVFDYCVDAQVNISGAASSMALRDVDNDGDLDWILAYDGLNKVVFNDATGGADGERPFNTPARVLSLGDNDDTRSIATGDIDNDGDIDIVEGNYGAVNKVWLNDL